MSTKQKELTPEQEERLEAVREKWVDFVSNGDTTIKDAEGEVAWLYSYAGLAVPDVIEVKSPLAAQIAVALLEDSEIFALLQGRDRKRVLKAISKVLATKRPVKIA